DLIRNPYGGCAGRKRVGLWDRCMDPGSGAGMTSVVGLDRGGTPKAGRYLLLYAIKKPVIPDLIRNPVGLREGIRPITQHTRPAGSRLGGRYDVCGGIGQRR